MGTATKTPKKQPTRKPRPLTPRERRLLAVLPEAKTLKEALLAAGYSKTTANSTPSRALDQIAGKCGESPLLKAFEKQGITDELIAIKHREGLEAYKVVSAKIVEKGAGAGDNDFIEIPDFMARHKYLDTQHKIRADFAPEKHEHSLTEELEGRLSGALKRGTDGSGSSD